ncbi:MAG: 50S ribosomal protein L9 [Candidatus Cloacimonadota bacterium]|nr:MAG: 50S ribosomal protein L9 [Candidatus Cloacimonadota bacterium]
MKVILLHDIEKLGLAGDVKNVKAGFARNYLLPKNLVIVASEGNLKRVEKIKVKAEALREEKLSSLNALARKVNETVLTFVRKADENGHLFGSVSDVDLTAEFANLDLDVHKSNIKLAKPIKELGEFEIEVAFGYNVSANFKVIVKTEDKDED